MSGFSSAFKGVAAAATLLIISPAHAAATQTSAAQLAGAVSSTAPIIGQQSDLFINVAGITSLAVLGAAGNTTRTVNIGAGSSVVGIGWSVNNTAFTPSWLSEMAVTFGPTGAAGPVLTVGSGDDFFGTGSYNSAVVDLVGLQLNFNAGADGLVRFEFFESFNDPEVSVDGIWNSGTLTLRVVAVPEPATYGMMALGLLAVGGMVRRRKA